MTRKEILEAAAACVCGDREEDYGTPEDNFRLIAELWSVYIQKRCAFPGTNVCVQPEDVAMLMVLLKIARIAAGRSKPDSYIDLAGYAACGGELGTGGAERKEKVE